tara:strand:+ start:1741 stop:2856 length:1116 start_codon:yes stop_codon:yes gene_type:complete
MLFLFIPFIVYFFILLIFALTNFIHKPRSLDSKPSFGVSIIVAIRNGDKSINDLISNLSAQDYLGPIEFILVDDESTDQTKKIILETVKVDSRFKYVSSLDGNKALSLKKKALDIGIQQSKYEYLFFTDVDCKMNVSWVSTMSKYFLLGYDYLVGYSFTDRSRSMNLVSRFQSLDLFFLMVLCRGSSFITAPWACSGQNQGFTKSLYNKVKGFSSITDFIGDDTAFLHLCKKYHAKITFVDEYNACILSRKEEKVSSLLLQRARWAFDANQIWRVNFSFYILLVVTFFAYLTIPFLIYSQMLFFNQLVILIGFKVLLEFILIFIGENRYPYKIKWFDFIVWEIFHIPYVIIVGIMSFFGNQIQWKNRHISI